MKFTLLFCHTCVLQYYSSTIIPSLDIHLTSTMSRYIGTTLATRLILQVRNSSLVTVQPLCFPGPPRFS